MKTFFRNGLAIQIGLVILLSLGAYTGTIPTSVPAIPHLDFVGHMIGIGGLAFFLDGVIDHRPLVRGHAFPRLAPCAVLLVAGIEEYLQRLSPRRSSSWSDFIADAIGVFFFAWLSLRVETAYRSRAVRAAS